MSAVQNKSTAFRRTVRLLPLLIGGAFASASAMATPAVLEQWAPGRILVQPKPGLPEGELAKILKAHGGKSVGRIDNINVHIVQLPANASEKGVAALLSKNPHLKFAERDMLVKPAGTANDPYFSSEWHLAKIGAPTAWDASAGSGQIIAILDTGIDELHPDLAGKLVTGWNFYDNNANTSDVHGHGTGVAGAAVTLTDNGLGVASVAPGAMLMPVRIADPNAYAYWSTVAQGLTWAADQGADVANISYVGVSGSSAVQSAAQYLKNKGGLVVVCAGNNGIDEAIAPSSTMISVSATDSNDVKTSWSSYGSFVDISAPGLGIYSTTRGGGYGSWSGTSLASPIVAGALALVKAANPSLAPADVENLIFSTAIDLGAPGFDSYYGNGRVNAAAAVQAALTATVKDTTAPTVSFASPSGGTTLKGVVTISVNAGDNTGVAKVELRANGNFVATDISAPYGFSLDTTSIGDGAVALSATAYDATGNYSTANLSVQVSNVADTIAPVATITNPTGSAKVTGVVSVAAAATDNVGVSSVALYIDGKKVSTASGSSVSYNWNTKKATSGSHVIVVQAQDAAGNLGSQSVIVTK